MVNPLRFARAISGNAFREVEHTTPRLVCARRAKVALVLGLETDLPDGRRFWTKHGVCGKVGRRSSLARKCPKGTLSSNLPACLSDLIVHAR